MDFKGYQQICFDLTFYYAPDRVSLLSEHYTRRMGTNPELDCDIAHLIESPARAGSDTSRALGFTADVSSSSRTFYMARAVSF